LKEEGDMGREEFRRQKKRLDEGNRGKETGEYNIIIIVI
jgi:hypothetical protein